MAMLNTREALRRQAPMILIAATLIGLAMIGNVPRLYDTHLRPRPWLDPIVEILPPMVGGKPKIRYGARPSIDLSGGWTAWLEVESVRCCTMKGDGNYAVGRLPREWFWADWLGYDWAVPDRPFVACVSYDVTADSGARGRFGPFCSAEFDPRSKP